MNKIEQAVSCFNEGFSCSQAIVSTYGPQFGLKREIALKISSAFGGGMGRLGETCGVVTGAIMVIGLKYGNTRVEEIETKEKALSLVKEFVEKFKAMNKCVKCNELLDCDISTPEGREIATSENRFKNLCPGFVRDSAGIIEEILDL